MISCNFNSICAKPSILHYFFYFFSIRMSEKGGKKKTFKNNKEATKDKKPITVKLNNSAEIPGRSLYKED